MTQTVTVILNGFRRKHVLKKQIEALKNQSYAIERIVYFTLKSEEYPDDYNYLATENIEVIECSHNYGVWGRFTIALNFDSDFIYIMDDDMIPGNNFISTCVDCYNKCPGIYGGTGLVLRDDHDIKNQLHNNFHFYGWMESLWGASGNKKPVKVSYLCGGWFFPSAALYDFWREKVDASVTHNRKIAEDIHLSYTAWKYAGLHSYVVPQLRSDKSTHANIADFAYSEDVNAIHLDDKLMNAMNLNFLYYCSRGLPYKFD